MKKYNMEKAICQVILEKFTSILVILAKKLGICKYTGKIIRNC
jgi:hypothetical protein